MAKFAVVVKDPQVAREREIERNFKHNLPSLRDNVGNVGHRTMLRKQVEAMVSPKQAGDLHTHIDEDCPMGLPNCRNCGDPDHAADCASKGHCPDCGTKHGIAPSSVVAANGFELIEIDGPKEDEEWDRLQKKFVAKKKA